MTKIEKKKFSWVRKSLFCSAVTSFWVKVVRVGLKVYPWAVQFSIQNHNSNIHRIHDFFKRHFTSFWELFMVITTFIIPFLAHKATHIQRQFNRIYVPHLGSGKSNRVLHKTLIPIYYERRHSPFSVQPSHPRARENRTIPFQIEALKSYKYYFYHHHRLIEFYLLHNGYLISLKRSFLWYMKRGGSVV